MQGSQAPLPPLPCLRNTSASWPRRYTSPLENSKLFNLYFFFAHPGEPHLSSSKTPGLAFPEKRSDQLHLFPKIHSNRPKIHRKILPEYCTWDVPPSWRYICLSCSHCRHPPQLSKLPGIKILWRCLPIWWPRLLWLNLVIPPSSASSARSWWASLAQWSEGSASDL